jgi:hypothetical protein
LWRTRRSAAVAGIVFAVLLLAALTMMRLALGDADPRTLQSDDNRRALVSVGLHLVPFAGIAFLWFIGVVRDRLGPVEDRLFSTVFLGSGLLFLDMLFQGAVTTTSLMLMLAGSMSTRTSGASASAPPPRPSYRCTRCAWRPSSDSP